LSQVSPRWNFESLYYKRSFTFNKKAGGNASVDVVFIDTVLLAGNSDDLEDKVGAVHTCLHACIPERATV
jgi:acid phosphatase/tartrate-resistant acid phosphatase type 5